MGKKQMTRLMYQQKSDLKNPRQGVFLPFENPRNKVWMMFQTTLEFGMTVWHTLFQPFNSPKKTQKLLGGAETAIGYQNLLWNAGAQKTWNLDELKNTVSINSLYYRKCWFLVSDTFQSFNSPKKKKKLFQAKQLTKLPEWNYFQGNWFSYKTFQFLKGFVGWFSSCLYNALGKN